MSNRLEELHAQYRRYYLKQYLKAAGVFLTASIFIYAIYFLTKTQEEPINTVKVVQVSEPVTKIIGQVKEIQTRENRPAYTLDVSADELDTAMQNIKNKKQNIKVSKPQVKEVKAKQSVAAQPVIVENSRENLFLGTQEEKSLESWIDKYNQKKSYAVAIYIAKQFYFDKDFKQSGIWAKRANHLDRNKEEAWLYYAKSVYALGNTVKAKRILNIYLQYKKSVKAELLLSEWSQ